MPFLRRYEEIEAKKAELRAPFDAYAKETKQELEDYLRYMLGKGYDINKLNLGPAGVMIKKK
jgi:hypothetical protein